jgi:hypothetical protein
VRHLTGEKRESNFYNVFCIVVHFSEYKPIKNSKQSVNIFLSSSLWKFVCLLFNFIDMEINEENNVEEEQSGKNPEIDAFLSFAIMLGVLTVKPDYNDKAEE